AAPHPSYVLFLSVSDGSQRAKVVCGKGNEFSSAWNVACEELSRVMTAEQLSGRWLRLDWVSEVQPMRWRDLKAFLACIKRNYFRYGLALDNALEVAFLEQELNA